MKTANIPVLLQRTSLGNWLNLNPALKDMFSPHKITNIDKLEKFALYDVSCDVIGDVTETG